MMQRYIPSEHAAALVAIPTPRIKTPAVKRKRYESRKTIKTQSRGQDARLREHCTPSTRARREIRWLTMETPSRWTTALTIVSRLIKVETEGGVRGRWGVLYPIESAHQPLIAN